MLARVPERLHVNCKAITPSGQLIMQARLCTAQRAIPTRGIKHLIFFTLCSTCTPSAIFISTAAENYSSLMAEALALVGIVASIVQLVDFSSKVLSRLNEFQSSVDEVPTSFRNVKVELPLLLDTLKHISKDISTGLIADEIQKSLLPVIEACQSQVESLDVVLVKTLPAPGDSRTQRTRKAISSLSQEAKVEKIGSVLRSHLLTLTFYYSVASSTLQPLKGKQVLTGRKSYIH